ncbi:MAG TPA: CBS domain-containing protein [Rhizomicrobium sp.]|nr:CBS domain-containing protein [Rhizomicrobium sp.]
MKIAEVMTRGVDLTDPDATLQEAAMTMAEDDVGFLPVGENDRVVGMITDRDIAVRAVAAGRDPKTTRVREVMTDRVLYCFEDEEIEMAAESMSRDHVRRLPIVNRRKRLVGVVSLGDIAVKHNHAEAGRALFGVCHAAV